MQNCKKLHFLRHIVFLTIGTDLTLFEKLLKIFNFNILVLSSDTNELFLVIYFALKVYCFDPLIRNHHGNAFLRIKLLFTLLCIYILKPSRKIGTD